MREKKSFSRSTGHWGERERERERQEELSQFFFSIFCVGKKRCFDGKRETGWVGGEKWRRKERMERDPINSYILVFQPASHARSNKHAKLLHALTCTV